MDDKEVTSSRRKILVTGVTSGAGALVLPGIAFAQQGTNGNASTVQTVATQDPTAVLQGLFDATMQNLPDGSIPSLQATQAAFASFGAIALQTRSQTITGGLDPDAIQIANLSWMTDPNSPPTSVSIDFQYDWTVPTYQDYVALEYQILPTYVALGATAPDNVVPSYTWQYFLSKFAGALGITEMLEGFKNCLDVLGKDILKRIALAIKNKAWSLLKNLIVELLDLIKSPGFFKLLEQEIGTVAAKKLIGTVLADALPIIGWVILVGQLVWAVANQYATLFQ